MGNIKVDKICYMNVFHSTKLSIYNIPLSTIVHEKSKIVRYGIISHYKVGKIRESKPYP